MERASTENGRRRLLVPAAAVVAAAAVLGARRARARAEADEHRPAQAGFMRAMHDAFRRDLDRLEDLASRIEERDTVPEGVRAGWDGLRDMLYSHHAAEDEDLWPVLRTKLHNPDDLREVDAMVEEHRAIPEALDAVEDALSRRDGLSAATRRLGELVRGHLEHEERTVVPLLEEHLSRAEWRRWLLTERDRHPFRERADFLGWVLDDAGDTDRAAVMAELPPPARLVYRLAIRPQYERQHRWVAA